MARLGNVFNNKEDIRKEEQHPRRTIKWIHYTKLKENPGQYCPERDKEEIEALADLIEAAGEVIQNLSVSKLDTDEYRIIAGHKRCKACKLLVEERGLKQFSFLPCVVSNLSSVQEEFQVVASNGYHQKKAYELMHEILKTEKLLKEHGVYTGTDGMSWCHAFVSWCANECGFIESNIIPKTAACETGRQWFIHKQQYQKAGSYTPQAGDIIYFDKGGVGESHHVGIVEYVENGIVHTIEGNKNNQVMRGHYELTYKGIMGYGTPDYPDEGLTSSTASEILSKAQEIGKMMVEEKWVYSNTDLKGSLAAAEQSAKRTNCAHGVCLVLQEVGLLKKGQIFFGNKSGELSCNGTVRKQIEKGFDIIKTGGKKSKDLDLKPGDICLFKGHTNIYAGKDENGKTYWYDFGRDQTKDKKPGSVFVKSVRKGEINWAVITVILRVKDQDSYGSGKTINIPSPYGDSFTYMGWSLITSTGSNQYKLRVKTGEHYDANGFGKIGDRYVIACTPTFGKIGDEIDFVLANGRVIHGVMGDEKNMSDAGCNKWGHDGGHSVVEFVVNKSMWYHTGKTVTRFHPEWASRVVKAVNLGKNHLR